jgi:hypothetical protein
VTSCLAGAVRRHCTLCRPSATPCCGTCLSPAWSFAWHASSPLSSACCAHRTGRPARRPTCSGVRLRQLSSSPRSQMPSLCSAQMIRMLPLRPSMLCQRCTPRAHAGVAATGIAPAAWAQQGKLGARCAHEVGDCSLSAKYTQHYVVHAALLARHALLGKSCGQARALKFCMRHLSHGMPCQTHTLLMHSTQMLAVPCATS